MENSTHRLIVVSYELYSVENGQEHFIEKTEEQKPMQFYTACEMALPAFEQEIVKYGKDTDFEFSLPKEQAYGEHDAKSVLALDKETFSHDGVFDSENIYKDAIVPLQNEQGQRFLGKDLQFRGHVIENRVADEAEVKDFFERMSQHHCGCGGDCGGDCNCGGGSNSCGEGSCGGNCGCH